MGSITRDRRRRLVIRGVAVSVLVAFGVGLVPAPAHAEDAPASAETSSTGTTSGAEEANADGTSTSGGDSTAEASDAPTVFEATASAVAARAVLEQLGSAATSGDLARARDAVGSVVVFLSSVDAEGVGASAGVDVDALLVSAEELRRGIENAAVSAAGTDGVVTPGAAAPLTGLVNEVVDGLTSLAFAFVSRVVTEVPAAGQVLEMARDVQDFVRGATVQTAGGLLEDLGRISGYLLDSEHQRTAKEALTTLLLTLANNVNYLPDLLAPTAELAVNAAGSFVAWADALVAQGMEGPGPFYTENTDTDEAPPAEDTTVIDSDLMVGEEPISVGPPPVPLAPPAPYGESGIAGLDPTASAAGRCGMYPGEICWPPVVSRGGRVIHKPIVRVVLVGTWWRNENEGLRAGLDNLFSSMSGSGYQSILRQYYDRAGGYIGPDVTYQGSVIIDGTPPAFVSVDKVLSYAITASRTVAGWKTSPSVVWMVALPPNSIADLPEGSDDKCGWQGYRQSGDRTYVLAALDYPREDEFEEGDDDGCMYVDGDRRGSLTAIAAHEYVGSVTNPNMRGWFDKTGKHLPDLCRARYVRGPGGEWVSELWSNGDDRCVSSFTPRFSYRVTSVRKPDGEQGPGSALTRGHSYPGAAIGVTNTGNMPWLSFGAKRTYLATADNQFSPFAHVTKDGLWVSRKRIALNQDIVDARADTTIVFTMKPDGSLPEGAPSVGQAFTVVAGTTWMTNTGSTPASVSNIELRRFNAEAVGVPTVGFVAAGPRGTDAKVKVTLRNIGTAHWHPLEVLNIGTDLPSPYRAGSWPSSTRAHRVTEYVPPGATYTFDLSVHVPTTDRRPFYEISLYPFADVRRVADGQIATTRVSGGHIPVILVVTPGPIHAHDVAGYGFASGDSVSTPADESGFSCLAVAGVDATRTRITSCRATITTAAGASYSTAVASASMDGPLAWTSALWTGYRPSEGDTVSVCWTAEATFLDGTGDTHSGCS